jgi:VWFA-related protein
MRREEGHAPIQEARRIFRNRWQADASGAAIMMGPCIRPFERRWHKILVTLVVAVTASAAVSADRETTQQVATFFSPIDVQLVTVEVRVTNADGEPIPGLTPADFEVREDGEPVEISHFFASRAVQEDSESVNVSSTVPAVPHQELYLALYFDDIDTDARRRMSVLSNLRDFLEQPLPPNVKTMLVRFDGQLHVVCDFSDDTDRLLVALDEIRDQPVFSFDREEQALFREMQGATTDQRGQIRQWMETETRQKPDFSNPGDMTTRPYAFYEADNRPVYHDSYLPKIRNFARNKSLRSRASLEALRRFVSYLNGVPGRKAVVWVGGLDTRPGESLFLAWEELFPDNVRRQGMSPMMEAQQYDMSRDLEQLLELANSRRVSFYTIGSLGAGLERISSVEVKGRDQSKRSGFSDIWGGEDELDIMSSSTGGRTLRDNSNLGEQLNHVSAELGAYYSLGYTPPSPGDDRYHSISVDVQRKGAHVRHRQGYRSAAGHDSAHDGVVAAATLGFTENPLGIGLEVQAQEPRPDGTFTVPVVVEIPIGNLALLPQKNLHTAGISMLSVVRDDHGRLSEIHDRELPVEIANNQLVSAITQEARFVLGMVLRDGAQRIAVSVQDTNSSILSTAFIDVEVGPDSTVRSR